MTKRSHIKKYKHTTCCFSKMIDAHHELYEFYDKYNEIIPNGFCHSNWKSFIPYLLIKPNNERHFLDFQNKLPRSLLKKYENALYDYLLCRKTDIWEAAFYLGKKPNFRKLCEFFFSEEEKEWRQEYKCETCWGYKPF